MIIATKVRSNIINFVSPDPTKPNAHGLSRKHILDAVEDSLKRLQTDYIDLYQVNHSSKEARDKIPEVSRTTTSAIGQFGICLGLLSMFQGDI